jgi:hypothetical protein
VVDVARELPNLSAKHEGGEPELEATREHPSDILDYFLPQAQLSATDLAALERNYLDKHDALQRTARTLLLAGLPVRAAPLLHEPERRSGGA